MAEASSENSDFEVLEPVSQSVPLVFNSPHSGRRYPQGFLDGSRLDALGIRRSEDHYVDELFSVAPALGAPMLVAHFPRAWLDVNREPYELDPRMFDGPLPSFANIGSIRVAGGLGTIPRVVAENMEIYRHRLPVEAALERIETVYKPYHARLRQLVVRTHVAFGLAVLVDCHSMPGNIRVSGSGIRPDFIIGDRYGTSASGELSRVAMRLLEDMGFSVVRNKPYAGGFITEHYGRPAKGLHALQIEVNRGLYIDEATLVKRPDFAVMQTAISAFLQDFSDYVEEYAADRALAAE
ncbi:N-formylglutamate amidohydrolase [Shinella zoogloeoides]|jgi:N-formylglutamate amidohydrolase|uniref:N-formylglutamate amidohydrolase n=1 Tax=Shinella zoogloeoides TaxID=352475 RepID=A0A6N8TF63_SHIZO|nr:N-formylglutamate amidohydrolase [Shinella zoogloeoides]MXN99843.1 N-formylglutamate amidohydrolase [Shinella zoogloeoides]UEX80671.1 N-formylglutamate amidohydrolase [Shinella zoogloeoides]